MGTRRANLAKRLCRSMRDYGVEFTPDEILTWAKSLKQRAAAKFGVSFPISFILFSAIEACEDNDDVDEFFIDIRRCGSKRKGKKS